MSEENQVADAPVETGQAASEATEFNFRDHIDETIRDDPSLATYKDINGMAKSLINAQKMVGADKVAIPGKYTTPEEMDAFYAKIGRPEAPDGYELKVNDAIGEDGVNFFKELAHKNGLTQTQADSILSEYGEYIGSVTNQTEEQIDQVRNEIDTQLKAEWGNEYQRKFDLANNVLDTFAPEDSAISEIKLSDGTLIGDNPVIVEFMSNVGQFLAEKIGEDSFSGRDNVPGMALDDVQKELNDLMAPSNTAYWDKNHPDHGRSVQRALQLREMINPPAA